MRAMLLLVVLLAAAAGTFQARVLAQEAAMSTKVGIQRNLLFPLIYEENGQYTGFDVAVKDRVNQLANLNAQVVLLNTYDDRITALENGTVDWVVSGFSVTPERAQRIDFVKPYYYSAGIALFTPNGTAPAGVTSWDSLRGQKVATLPGYYGNDILASNYSISLVIVPTREDAAAAVANGTAVGFVDDSTNLRPAGDLRLVSSLEPIARTPYAIAVKKGNTALADKISNALYQMASGGSSSDLARLEQQYFIANGAPPNPDLAALLANPKGNSTLTG